MPAATAGRTIAGRALYSRTDGGRRPAYCLAKAPVADIRIPAHPYPMAIEHDANQVPAAADRMHQAMVELFNLIDDANKADFPIDLISDLNVVRLRLIDEFERKFPGYSEGRNLWR